MVDAIRSLSLKNNKLIVCSENSNAPEMHITYSKNEGRNVYRLEWSPRSNALAWHDVALKELNAFHQLLLPGKDTFSMHFYRDFTGRQVHILAKFIAYYYAKIWQISEDELVIVDYLSENTKSIITNMSIEEYVKKTGYKTYEEIKKKLGLK